MRILLSLAYFYLHYMEHARVSRQFLCHRPPSIHLNEPGPHFVMVLEREPVSFWTRHFEISFTKYRGTLRCTPVTREGGKSLCKHHHPKRR